MTKPTSAVLCDGTALFHSARNLHPDDRLDYSALVNVLCDEVPNLERPETGTWIMWTAAAPENQGQQNFIDYIQNRLKWYVRREQPSLSYLVQPAALFGQTVDLQVANPLQRFDTRLSYALGSLEKTRPVVCVSDGFSLVEPLRLASRIAAGVYAAWFRSSLDSRWQRALNRGLFPPDNFVDLDQHTERLFGKPSPEDDSHDASRFSFSRNLVSWQGCHGMAQVPVNTGTDTLFKEQK